MGSITWCVAERRRPRAARYFDADYASATARMTSRQYSRDTIALQRKKMRSSTCIGPDRHSRRGAHRTRHSVKQTILLTSAHLSRTAGRARWHRVGTRLRQRRSGSVRLGQGRALGRRLIGRFTIGGSGSAFGGSTGPGGTGGGSGSGPGDPPGGGNVITRWPCSHTPVRRSLIVVVNTRLVDPVSPSRQLVGPISGSALQLIDRDPDHVPPCRVSYFSVAQGSGW